MLESQPYGDLVGGLKIRHEQLKKNHNNRRFLVSTLNSAMGLDLEPYAAKLVRTIQMNYSDANILSRGVLFWYYYRQEYSKADELIDYLSKENKIDQETATYERSWTSLMLGNQSEALKIFEEGFPQIANEKASNEIDYSNSDYFVVYSELLKAASQQVQTLDITKLEAGDVIDGRYKFVRQIGKGAFGTVLLVEDQVVDEQLVLKFLNPGVAQDEEMMKRFIHELRYSRKITHRNIIRIYDFVSLGGLYAISMEYFASHPLSSELQEEQPLPFDRALRYGTDIATGMFVAHQAGVIHRDLKPANVLIDKGGLVKVVDFGVAAARASGDTQLTRTGYVIGSPKYMAPEQILGKKVDEKADIYSLGVILYEMLTGFAPYTRGDHMSVMYQHVQGKAKPARELNPDIPHGLSDIVTRCMAVDKSKRFSTMEELRGAIAPFFGAEG